MEAVIIDQTVKHKIKKKTNHNKMDFSDPWNGFRKA